MCIDCTRKWIGNAAYIVYVTSLAIRRTEVQVFGQERNLWLPHFRTFCELVEGEENKLTTFSTRTIMLGCNESNIIFQQHLCKLGQLWRSNGRNSQVLGQAMKKRPTGHYKKYSHFKGRDTAPTTSSREGSCIVDSSTSGERTLWLKLKSLAGRVRRTPHTRNFIT